MVVVMMVDLVSRPCFFVGAAMGPIDRPHFRFTGMSVVGVGLGRADGLVIDGAVLMGADVAVGFTGLSLW